MSLIHVYHQDFSGGIGDFLKGTIYLYKICYDNNISIHMDWSNHPISQYITTKHIIPKYSLDYILEIDELAIKSPQYQHLNFHDRMQEIIGFIINSIKDNTKHNIVLSSFFLDIERSDNPLKNIVNYRIDSSTKKYIQDNMMISKDIKKIHATKFGNKKYGTIHFRLGDRHILQKLDQQLDQITDGIKNNYNLRKIDHDYDYLYHIINKHIKTNNFNYIILLSDCNNFKKYIDTQKNNKIIIPHYESNHTSSKPGFLKFSDCYKNNYSDQHAKHTAIDLEILINSQKNITYSVYNWGSGFAIWPSKVFNVPLEAFHLNYHTAAGIH